MVHDTTISCRLCVQDGGIRILVQLGQLSQHAGMLSGLGRRHVAGYKSKGICNPGRGQRADQFSYLDAIGQYPRPNKHIAQETACLTAIATLILRLYTRSAT